MREHDLTQRLAYVRIPNRKDNALKLMDTQLPRSSTMNKILDYNIHKYISANCVMSKKAFTYVR